MYGPVSATSALHAERMQGERWRSKGSTKVLVRTLRHNPWFTMYGGLAPAGILRYRCGYAVTLPRPPLSFRQTRPGSSEGFCSGGLGEWPRPPTPLPRLMALLVTPFTLPSWYNPLDPTLPSSRVFHYPLVCGSGDTQTVRVQHYRAGHHIVAIRTTARQARGFHPGACYPSSSDNSLVSFRRPSSRMLQYARSRGRRIQRFSTEIEREGETVRSLIPSTLIAIIITPH